MKKSSWVVHREASYPWYLHIKREPVQQGKKKKGIGCPHMTAILRKKFPALRTRVRSVEEFFVIKREYANAEEYILPISWVLTVGISCVKFNSIHHIKSFGASSRPVSEKERNGYLLLINSVHQLTRAYLPYRKGVCSRKPPSRFILFIVIGISISRVSIPSLSLLHIIHRSSITSQIS